MWLTDMNRDGLDDLIVTQPTVTSDGLAYQLTISVYPSNGDGTFGTPTVTNSAPSGYYPTPILVDLTDDGIPDIVAASGSTLSLFAGASGGFNAEVNWSPGQRGCAWVHVVLPSVQLLVRVHDGRR